MNALAIHISQKSLLGTFAMPLLCVPSHSGEAPLAHRLEHPFSTQTLERDTKEREVAGSIPAWSRPFLHGGEVLARIRMSPCVQYADSEKKRARKEPPSFFFGATRRERRRRPRSDLKPAAPPLARARAVVKKTRICTITHIRGRTTAGARKEVARARRTRRS